MTTLYLNDIWRYYYHDPYNTDWTYKSYLKLSDVSDINDFWYTHNSIKHIINNGMFFIMREYVFPCWDDENNLNGGCFTIKILKQNSSEFWENISIKLLGETLLKGDNIEKWNNINGISISPKKSFCIIKIWMKNNDIQDSNLFNLPPNIYGDIFYKSNKDLIACDQSNILSKITTV